jgi:tellurite resistance protein TerC
MLPLADMQAWLTAPLGGTPAWAWLLFVSVVIAPVVLDPGVRHSGRREIGVKESLVTSALYKLAALVFAGWIYASFGSDDAMRFLTGHVEPAVSLPITLTLLTGGIALSWWKQRREASVTIGREVTS